MRIVVVSDIHSNLVALETVLADAGSYDALWCLGDTIGYGPAPNECVALMRQHATLAICGNHDLACLGRIDLRDFNPDARKANLWNGEQLAQEHRVWLEGLDDHLAVDERFLLAHGSPRQPVWEYLLSAEQALANFALFPQEVCLIGHSHVQLGFSLRPGDTRSLFFRPPGVTTVALDGTTRYFVNPGSVGQPRDQDPRAAYAVIDTDANTITYQRVAYDIARTQQQMAQVGLPVALIRRLEFGM